jgi:hypothetical protein
MQELKVKCFLKDQAVNKYTGQKSHQPRVIGSALG